MATARLAIIGAGKLGETLLKGLLDAGSLQPSDVRVSTKHAERAQAVAARHGVTASPDNATAARGAELVLLCVKPQQVAPVLDELREVLTPDQLLVSVAASASTRYNEERLAHPVPVVRAMPNTPAMIGRGMTAICAGRHASSAQLDQASAIFDAVGRTVRVDEIHMDAVTGLSASGPAFLYIVIESLADAGVKVGLPRHIATELAAQTVRGSGAMVLVTGEHPAKLKDEVTTPGGTTIDGILELEDGGLRVTLIKAVVKATQRAQARARELEGGQA